MSESCDPRGHFSTREKRVPATLALCMRRWPTSPANAHTYVAQLRTYQKPMKISIMFAAAAARRATRRPIISHALVSFVARAFPSVPPRAQTRNRRQREAKVIIGRHSRGHSVADEEFTLIFRSR